MAEPDDSANLVLERRHALRVPVRRMVRAAIGLRSFEALLLDLSLSGCRLRCGEPITAHGSLWVVLPTGVCDVALRFRALSARASDRLQAAITQVLAPVIRKENAERRHSSRRWFGTRVIAGGPGSPRVLLARDLSEGGMQVENAAGLVVGQEIQLALHSQAGDVPLVLRGRVLRCNAKGEAAFRFLPATEAQRGHLERLLASLPAVDAPVVAEILEPTG